MWAYTFIFACLKNYQKDNYVGQYHNHISLIAELLSHLPLRVVKQPRMRMHSSIGLGTWMWYSRPSWWTNICLLFWSPVYWSENSGPFSATNSISSLLHVICPVACFMFCFVLCLIKFTCSHNVHLKKLHIRTTSSCRYWKNLSP